MSNLSRASLLTAACTIALLGQSWVDPDQSEPLGTRYKTFFSQTVQGEVSYLIYLPPGYETAQDQRYPVIYWLHGLGGNQRTGAAAFVPQLDAAIRSGQSPAAIVVLVNGLRDSRWYDSFDGQRPVETVFIKDLIPHVDRTYRTVAGREGRAVEGYSMGGFGAARLGFKYPGLFGAVSIMAGALLHSENVAITHPELFEKNFGRNLAYFEANSPWMLVEKNAGALRGATRIRIGVGEKDSLREVNRKLHEALERLRIGHEYFVVPGVAHQGALFYKTLGPASLKFYRKAFAPGGGPS